MSWLSWDSFKSLVVKPDQSKCDAQKKEEDEKHKKIVADEEVRHSKALSDIENNLVCKKPVQSSGVTPTYPAPATNNPVETVMMGGKKSKKSRRNKKKKTKRM